MHFTPVALVNKNQMPEMKFVIFVIKIYKLYFDAHCYKISLNNMYFDYLVNNCTQIITLLMALV